MRTLVAAHQDAVDSAWTFFAVVREPLDRFISGYVDKCWRHVASVSLKTLVAMRVVAEKKSVFMRPADVMDAAEI